MIMAVKTPKKDAIKQRDNHHDEEFQSRISSF